METKKDAKNNLEKAMEIQKIFCGDDDVKVKKNRRKNKESLEYEIRYIYKLPTRRWI